VAFNWEDYLRLAKQLSQDSTDEAALRSAVSRAYYAVFCKARNMVSRETGRNFTGTAEDHQEVWNTYRLKGGTPRTIGDWGVQLRNSRNLVDYDNEVKNLSSVVQKSIEKAERILAHLKTQPGGMP
jgi:uncharacterized protein (UPF0332 family)